MTQLPDPSSPLDEATAYQAFADMLDGKPSEEDIEHFLTVMTERDETAVEIAAAASAMRERLIAIEAPEGAIDVCGTGGDGQHTLNVSTAVSIVVASLGVPVAKHGNRAASSKAGASDTLEALGLDLDHAGEIAERSLADLGICFLHAANHHPAMKRITPIRKRIGKRTIFNLMGPISNPAGVKRQLIGIARPDYVPVYAEALKQLGAEAAMVVSGEEGLDELSISGPSRIGSFGNVDVGESVAPGDAGLESFPIDAIRGGDPHFNATALTRLFEGETGGYRNAVVLNAAGALIVAGKAGGWENGASQAAGAIDDGRAKDLLNRWIDYR
ncbi:anthranilate phosphoribosyltransferase [Parasphingopyxis algicola]|uniref:anthranilate phosphoribosyltransferase n=1 Tax=Parasphingopyxis algicola TaxID=2026624 RepID=UPI0015A38E08|nr:anthranilate phosphoribosyltransferase [Parasphingopyxis algicola]QLC24358.1 anthranilate phosphoribosyltransferase [Parasphingopyxis algicola]